ncbi:UNVERIFIED_CONTAM: hypothetical protein FKN15_043508 [Acipenser sinensis]
MLGACSSTLDARCTHLNARRFGASTLGARTSTLDASALRRSVHAPRHSTLRRSAHRRLDVRCMLLDARRFGARCTHLDARRLVRRRLDAQCTRLDARFTHLDARRFGARHLARRLLEARCTHLDARRSVLDAPSMSCSTEMSGFHRCMSCQAKLPASDPHDETVACLGPEHAASALADRAFCHCCAGFQTRTLRQRAKKSVGGHSPSLGSSHTISASPSSTTTPPGRLQLSTSPASQITAGQRSPTRRARARSPSPSRVCPHREPGSPSRSPRRRGRSRSPRRDRRCRDRSGVVELTSKMSQFMEMMMGQQSLLMSMANAMPRAPEQFNGPVANQPVASPQPPLAVSLPVQPQDWDIDAISRDASDILGEDSIEAEVASQHSDQVAESEGASEAGLASFPPVDAAFAALVKTPTLSGLVKDPACPNKQCRTTEIHLKKGYLAATEAVKLSNVASLLTVYQASLIRDLPEHLSPSLKAELALVAQFLVKIAQLNARAQGRSIASLVVARRQLWLSQARVQEPDKAPLLDAPITPGHTFGPAVEEMLQRSVKAREASQQMAKMWPHKPFQPRRHQEHQWHRAPPQRQTRPGGTKTSPSATAARSQPHFSRPQRGGWRPRGGGRPRPRGSGQPPREQAQPKQP